MAEIKRTIIINASIDKVFMYVSNYRNWSEFYIGLSEVKPITEKTRSTGSKFIYKVKMLGVNFTVGTEFQDFKENVGWIGKSFKGIESRTQWSFKKLNGNTEFTHGVSYEMPWYLGGKLFDSLLGKSTWIKIIENSLQNVKRITELS